MRFLTHSCFVVDWCRWDVLVWLVLETSRSPIFSILETSSIKMFVLDEADEMLSRGFKDQIYEVFKCMPNDVQVRILGFFSIQLFFLLILKSSNFLF